MEFFDSLFKYIIVTAPYLLFGFLIAGILKEFISMEYVKRSLGAKGLLPIIKASIIGIPLPLCSCSVIPTAVTLKKNGASNGATSSFLVSTPESGIDSIAITYSVMDLPMTIIRPLAAFLTAFLAGTMQLIFNENNDNSSSHEQKTNNCKCSQTSENNIPKKNLKKIFDGVKYAFTDLMDDIVVWLLIGLILGALIDFLVPAGLFLKYNGFIGKLIIMGIGIPFYVCASSSTPIAVSLMVKGMSPGTALIFLLVGPATNISNLLVMQQYIGKKGVLINIISIGVMAFLLSYGVDYIYDTFKLPLNFKVNNAGHDGVGYSTSEIFLSIMFCTLMIKSLYKTKIKPLFINKNKSCCENDKCCD